MAETRSPTILCLASYEKGADFLRECKHQGWRVLLLTTPSLENVGWPREAIDDIFFIADMYDRKAMVAGVSWLARGEQIERIAALDDFDVEIAATLREHLRLPGIGDSQARYFRDKLAMRVKAEAAGIRVPAFTHVLNDARLHEWTALVPPPWVLKPRSEASSVGIRKLTTPEQLWSALDSLGDRRSFFLLEHYVAGPVYHVDALINRGQVVFAETHRYGTPLLDVVQSGGIFTSRTLPRGSDDDLALRGLNQALVGAFALRQGVAHTEFIKGADGAFYFLETAARVAGANIAELVTAATGVNLWREWARIELSGDDSYALPPQRQEHSGIVTCLARQEHPSTAAYQEPEVAWRLDKHHHVGLVIASPDPERVDLLLADYAQRFAEDFLATLPAPNKPTS